MFRRLVIFIVLLVHINGSMLLPQVAECDIYTAGGQQKDDINSVIEYLDKVILEHDTTNPVDEDNDQGQNFHLVKMVDYCYAIEFTTITHKPAIITSSFKYALLPAVKLYPVTLEILAPPPKA